MKFEVHEFVKDISMVGVGAATDPSRSWFSRIAWFILVSTAIGLATYQIQERFIYYANFPATTEVGVRYQKELEFPQVTICNENEMFRTPAEKHGIAEVLERMHPPFHVPGFPEPDLSVLRDLNYTQEEWERLQVDLAQIPRRAIPFPFSFHLHNLTWRNVTTIHTDMGVCFAFNTKNESYSTVQAGAIFGLSIVLYANQNDYLVSTSGSAGFRILVHDKEEIPLMQQSGILVSPGVRSSIAIELLNITEIGEPYSDCQGDRKYRNINCVLKCITENLVKHCNCKQHNMPGPYRECTILEDYECLLPRYNEFAVDGLSKCDCPRECFSRMYKHSVSQSILSERFKHFVSNHTDDLITADRLVHDYSAIEIFYSDLKYMDITMSPTYSFSAVLSDIGGALGLALGATVLTFFQLIEISYDVIMYFHTRRKTDVDANEISMDSGVLERDEKLPRNNSQTSENGTKFYNTAV